MRNEHPDHEDYFHFTGPARVHKAVHLLEGIVDGIAVDGHVDNREIGALLAWVGEHQEFQDHHPFNEFIPALSQILADGIVDPEERANILWLCQRFSTDEGYYDEITSDMQRLQGMMTGIAADGEITPDELRNLEAWMSDREHLRCCWPYDELETLITRVLKDGEIDKQEHQQLLAFFDEFASRPGHRVVDTPINELKSISAIFALSPEIIFAERKFCFTGSSKRATKKELQAVIERGRGVYSKGVVQDLNYLIVGADGNPCWAFAAYGRKVEEAIAHRKSGCRMLICSEVDFWDAARDEGLVN